MLSKAISLLKAAGPKYYCKLCDGNHFYTSAVGREHLGQTSIRPRSYEEYKESLSEADPGEIAGIPEPLADFRGSDEYQQIQQEWDSGIFESVERSEVDDRIQRGLNAVAEDIGNEVRMATAEITSEEPRTVGYAYNALRIMNHLHRIQEKVENAQLSGFVPESDAIEEMFMLKESEVHPDYKDRVVVLGEDDEEEPRYVDQFTSHDLLAQYRALDVAMSSRTTPILELAGDFNPSYEGASDEDYQKGRAKSSWLISMRTLEKALAKVSKDPRFKDFLEGKGITEGDLDKTKKHLGAIKALGFDQFSTPLKNRDHPDLIKDEVELATADDIVTLSLYLYSLKDSVGEEDFSFDKSDDFYAKVCNTAGAVLDNFTDKWGKFLSGELVAELIEEEDDFYHTETSGRLANFFEAKGLGSLHRWVSGSWLENSGSVAGLLIASVCTKVFGVGGTWSDFDQSSLEDVESQISYHGSDTVEFYVKYMYAITQHELSKSDYGSRDKITLFRGIKDDLGESILSEVGDNAGVVTYTSRPTSSWTDKVYVAADFAATDQGVICSLKVPNPYVYSFYGTFKNIYEENEFVIMSPPEVTKCLASSSRYAPYLDTLSDEFLKSIGIPYSLDGDPSNANWLNIYRGTYEDPYGDDPYLGKFQELYDS